jgi:DNA topoisomerase-2
MAFEKLTNQARFVQMIVADLRGHKFRPFSKTSANTGETEPAEEDNEEEGTQTDFDY